MKSTATKATVGILFILLGIALAGKALGLFNFNIFFNGWWTMFIIIPCALGLSDRGHRTSSMIGLGVGILLLLSSQGVLAWYMFGRILVAFLFIVIGCSIMFRGRRDRDYYRNPDDRSANGPDGNEGNYTYNGNTGYDSDGNGNSYNDFNGSGSTDYKDNSYGNDGYNGNNYGNQYDSGSSYNRTNEGSNHGGYNHFSSFLSGRTVQFVDEVFTGAVVTSVLGSIQLDLRNAVFKGNASVETTCILGGVDIYVPSNVKVVNNCSSILAGVDNDVVSPINSYGEYYTLFINGTCILGGIEVK